MVGNERCGGIVEPVAHDRRRPAERHRRQTVRQGRRVCRRAGRCGWPHYLAMQGIRGVA
jgi:hypothetical protein